jgi:hypothetical protein
MGPRRIISSSEEDSTLSRNVGIRSSIDTASHVQEELSPDLFWDYYHHRHSRRRHYHHHHHHHHHQTVKKIKI